VTGADAAENGVARPDRCCLWRIFLRTLSLQGSWNTQRMQNLGLVYALLPWLRRAELPSDEARRFCRRHYEYFNTNPYYANLLIGGLLRLEEENRRADGALLKTVRTFKDTLGRALASLGDQFVWLGLQPALLVVASLSAASGSHRGPLVLVGGFALVQLAWRYRILVWGYDLGLEIADRLTRPQWHRAIWTAKRSGALFTGVLAGLYTARLEHLLRAEGARTLLLGAALALGLSLAARRRWPGESLLLLMLPLAVALTYL
jgi:PTS system mannose-specific IID component